MEAHAGTAPGAFGGALLWGHEPCKGCANMGVYERRGACGRRPWAFSGAPYGATILVRGVPKWVRCRHANAATGAFSGAPYGATILVTAVPKWIRGLMTMTTRRVEGEEVESRGGTRGTADSKRGPNTTG